MRDCSDDLKDLRRRLGEAEGYLKIDVGRSRLAELEMEVSRPDLWDDQELAKKVNGEYSNVKGDIDTFDALSREMEDVELCLLYTSPSPRDRTRSRMPSSA